MTKNKGSLVFPRKPLFNLIFSGAAEEIRTPGLQVRSLLLYPAELQPRNVQMAN